MKLHIGNLSKSVTQAELKDLVIAIAEPISVEVVHDGLGESRGYAFAEFADDEKARAVIGGLDGKEIGGQSVKVAEARPRKGDKPAAAAPTA